MCFLSDHRKKGTPHFGTLLEVVKIDFGHFKMSKFEIWTFHKKIRFSKKKN